MVRAARFGAGTCWSAPLNRPNGLRATAITITSRGPLGMGCLCLFQILPAQGGFIDLAVRRARQRFDHRPSLGSLDAEQRLAMGEAGFFGEPFAPAACYESDGNFP